jgi:hypothetical protein
MSKLSFGTSLAQFSVVLPGQFTNRGGYEARGSYNH